MYEDLKLIKEEYIREIIHIFREKGLNDEKTAELLDTLIHSAKNVCKLLESCEEDSRYGMMDHPYSRSRSRDSMGRYNTGRYGTHEDIVSGLYGLMDKTHDETARRDIQDMIHRMENR